MISDFNLEKTPPEFLTTLLQKDSCSDKGEEVSNNKAIPELNCTQEIEKEATDDNDGITNNYTSPGGQEKCRREMAMGEGKTTMTAWWRIIALLWACSQIEVYEGEAIQSNSILGNARQMDSKNAIFSIQNIVIVLIVYARNSQFLQRNLFTSWNRTWSTVK